MKHPHKRSKKKREAFLKTLKKRRSQKLPPKRSIDDILRWTSLQEWLEEAEGNPKIWKDKQVEFCQRAAYKKQEMPENKENTWILRYSNNEIAGAIQFWPERSSDRSHVIEISPDCDNGDIMYLSIIHGWKKKQGHPLMCAFLNKALSTDCRYVQLQIKRYDNDFLLEFYKRYGFKVIINKKARIPRPVLQEGYLVMFLDLHSSPALVKMLLENVFQ